MKSTTSGNHNPLVALVIKVLEFKIKYYGQQAMPLSYS
jgi:hypothetical protein